MLTWSQVASEYRSSVSSTASFTSSDQTVDTLFEATSSLTLFSSQHNDDGAGQSVFVSTSSFSQSRSILSFLFAQTESRSTSGSASYYSSSVTSTSTATSTVTDTVVVSSGTSTITSAVTRVQTLRSVTQSSSFYTENNTSARTSRSVTFTSLSTDNTVTSTSSSSVGGLVTSASTFSTLITASGVGSVWPQQTSSTYTQTATGTTSSSGTSTSTRQVVSVSSGTIAHSSTTLVGSVTHGTTVAGTTHTTVWTEESVGYPHSITTSVTQTVSYVQVTGHYAAHPQGTVARAWSIQATQRGDYIYAIDHASLGFAEGSFASSSTGTVSTSTAYSESMSSALNTYTLYEESLLSTSSGSYAQSDVAESTSSHTFTSSVESFFDWQENLPYTTLEASVSYIFNRTDSQVVTTSMVAYTYVANATTTTAHTVQGVVSYETVQRLTAAPWYEVVTLSRTVVTTTQRTTAILFQTAINNQPSAYTVSETVWRGDLRFFEAISNSVGFYAEELYAGRAALPSSDSTATNNELYIAAQTVLRVSPYVGVGYGHFRRRAFLGLYETQKVYEADVYYPSESLFKQTFLRSSNSYTFTEREIINDTSFVTRTVWETVLAGTLTTLTRSTETLTSTEDFSYYGSSRTESFTVAEAGSAEPLVSISSGNIYKDTPITEQTRLLGERTIILPPGRVSRGTSVSTQSAWSIYSGTDYMHLQWGREFFSYEASSTRTNVPTPAVWTTSFSLNKRDP